MSKASSFTGGLVKKPQGLGLTVKDQKSSPSKEKTYASVSTAIGTEEPRQNHATLPLGLGG
jgi:hypothetical protein